MRYGLLALGLLLGSAGMARAADGDALAKIALSQGADRQAMLEAGARAEGALTIYTVGAQIDPLMTAFSAHYPFITARVLKADGPALVKRVTEEYQAGLYTVDAYEMDDYGIRLLQEAGVLASFRSPEMAVYGPDSFGPNNSWVMMRRDLISFGFNTDSVSPDAAPHSNADLLDAKWKGKLGISASVTAIVTWVGALALSEGENFVRKLGKQDLRLYNLGGRAVANLVVSGEAPLVVNARRSHMFASRKEGAHVAWRALGPSYASVSGVALAGRPQHPNAAMLFIDFQLGLEAQKIYSADLGYGSMRHDMPGADAPVTALNLTLRPDFYREYEAWNDLSDEVFGAQK
jgi:iron(III) transport system substrate-binding protein